MKRFIVLFTLVISALLEPGLSYSQTETYPVRGFCIAAPERDGVNDFVKFINDELAPRKVNTLILRVEYNYEFKSHPELRDSVSLTEKDVKAIVESCKKNNITVIPQINLLGHQSWAERTNNLLRVYPQFDETPHVKMPEKYVWPNADGLYCKSYCPLHPDVHKIVFALMDEICDVFEANAFHAGMDEVFYIGDDRCPRCGGHDKAELFANEVSKIQDHLRQQNRRLWIWGDRLIDGKTTGLGMWEASMNQTYRAVDLIPKDVVVCDWHYERADKTAVYFAMKGLDVVTCPWRTPSLALKQSEDMIRFREESTKEMRERFKGIVQTVWSDPASFLDGYYGRLKEVPKDNNTAWDSFKALFPKPDDRQNESKKKNKK